MGQLRVPHDQPRPDEEARHDEHPDRVERTLQQRAGDRARPRHRNIDQAAWPVEGQELGDQTCPVGRHLHADHPDDDERSLQLARHDGRHRQPERNRLDGNDTCRGTEQPRVLRMGDRTHQCGEQPGNDKPERTEEEQPAQQQLDGPITAEHQSLIDGE